MSKFKFKFRVNFKRFNGEERRKLELIKKAKEFGKTIGLSETRNFTNFVEECKTLKNLCGFSDTILPFSEIDPDFFYFKYSSDDQKVVREGYILRKVEFFALSGNSFVTRDLIKTSNDKLVGSILHEDFHDSVSLPRHIDEAAAKIVEIFSRTIFNPNNSKKFAFAMLKRYLCYNVLPNLNCFDELKKVYDKLSLGKITLKTFERKRGKILLRYRLRKEGLVGIIFEMIYHYYFPLLLELLQAFDCDISAFISFFKEFPYKEVRGGGRLTRKYFEETRQIEIEAEKYIKNKIKELRR